MAHSSESNAVSAPGRADRTVELLEERSGVVTIGELADAVSRAEGVAVSPGAVHEDLFRRILPALEEQGELRFDVERGVVILDQDDGDTLLARLAERLSR